MKVKELMISLMLFSGVIIGITSFQGALMSNYDRDTYTENISTIEKSHEVNNKMESIQNNIENFEITNPLTWGNLVGLGIDMFKVLFTIPGMVHGIVVDIVTLVNLPGWFASIVEGVVLIIFVFGAYTALRGGQV